MAGFLLVNIPSLRTHINTPGYDGNTPLHLAAREEHDDVVECLLKHGANPRQKDNAGRTAIDIAPYNTRTSRLLETHCTCLDRALHEAEQKGDSSTAKMLANKGSIAGFTPVQHFTQKLAAQASTSTILQK